MGWFANWRARRAEKRFRKALDFILAEHREVDWPTSLLPRDDGFVPDAVFAGGDLVTNLEASVWSFAAVTANAEGVASLPPVVQRRGKSANEPKWVTIQGHPLEAFLREPLGNRFGPAPRWTWQKLFEVTALQIELCGNGFWLPEDLDGGRRLAVRPLRKPHLMKADEDGWGYPVTYRHELGTFRPGEIVNFQNSSPSSFWKGQSVFEACRRDIDIDRTAHRRTQANLKNRLGASVVFKKDGWLSTVPKEEKDRILARLKAEYQATARDGVPLVIGKAWEMDQIPAQDHSKIIFDARRMSREGIMAATKVPPTILGIYENATLQNFNISRVIWWTNKLFPLAAQIYGDLNLQLIWPRFGPDIRLWYDVAGTPIGLTVVREKAETAGVMVEKLGYPANLAAAHVSLGMPWVEGLDEANTHLAKAGREPPGGEKADPDQEAKAAAEAEAAAAK